MQILGGHGCPIVLWLALRVLSSFCSNMFQQFEDQFHKPIQSASSWMQESNLTITYYLKLWLTWYWVVCFDARLTSSLISALPKSQSLWELNNWKGVHGVHMFWTGVGIGINGAGVKAYMDLLGICVIVLLEEVQRRCLQQKPWNRLQMSQNCFRLDLRSYRSNNSKYHNYIDMRYTELHLAAVDWGGNWLTNILTG